MLSYLNLSVAYGTDLSANITSCVMEAENCMTLLLSGHIDTDQCGIDDFGSVGFGDCEDTSEMNKEFNINDCYSQLVCEHKDVDIEMQLTVDSVSSGRLADVGKSSDSSMALSTDAIDRSHHEQSVTVNEPPDVNLYRQHGVHSFRYALHIDIASHISIEQTEENTDVVRTLQELTTVLVSRYIPAVKHWLEVNIYIP